jgi:hypothetical protein
MDYMRGTGNRLTPVWAPYDRIIASGAGGGSITRDAKVGEFDSAIFGRQDVGALDITVDDTLVMEVYKTIENLRYVDGDQVFWELSESLADVVQRAVLAESSEGRSEKKRARAKWK